MRGREGDKVGGGVSSGRQRGSGWSGGAEADAEIK